MQWFRECAAYIPPPRAHASHQVFLPILLPPVIRSAEDASGHVHGAVREMAAEILQLLQKRAAAPDFALGYQVCVREPGLVQGLTHEHLTNSFDIRWERRCLRPLQIPCVTFSRLISVLVALS